MSVAAWGREARAWSVRTYLVLIVAVAVAAVTAATGYGFLWSSGQARKDATTEMTLQARRAAASISTSVAAGRKTVEGLAAQPGLDKVFDHPRGCQLSADGIAPFASVRLDIVGPDGQVACSSAPSPSVTAPVVHARSAWLRDGLRASGTLVAWNATDAATRKPAIAVMSPVRHGGASVGVVVLVLHVPGTAATLAGTVAGSEHASFTLIDRRAHRVLAASEARGSGAARPGGARFPDAERQGEWPGVDGSRRVFGSADVSPGGWRVFAGVRRSAVLTDARGTLMRQALIGLLALLMLVGAVWILNRRVAGPLRAVTEAVARANRDPDGPRIAASGPAELVALGREFNAMLDIRAGHDAQLLHQATHDPVTGLPNKILLRDRLDDALHRAGTEVDIGVLWVGISRLDIVNDGFGHEAGDRVSAEVASRLSTALRSGDTLARFATDQFVVLCGNLAGGDAEADTVDVAERLQRSLERPFRGPEADIMLQCSIGIAISRRTTTTADQLLREADTAMREAKSTGQSWFQFDRELQRRATQHLALEHALWQALRRDEFVVHYQPLVDVATRSIVGTEALVRWNHPERGLVGPMEFIPIAEEMGQIAAIGRLVLTRACEQAAAWTAAGHDLRMSVNVAVDQLRDEEFPGVVAQVLSDTGLAPDRLCLEITESSLVREAEQGSSALARLRRLGVHLAIDDFGTGYSALSYLHDLPVDELKVDRSFIARLDCDRPDPRDKHLVEAIIVMARALDLSVVAEGVESERQLRLLAGLGCDLAQGYLFSRPQSPENVLGLLSSSRGRPRVAALAR